MNRQTLYPPHQLSCQETVVYAFTRFHYAMKHPSIRAFFKVVSGLFPD